MGGLGDIKVSFPLEDPWTQTLVKKVAPPWANRPGTIANRDGHVYVCGADGKWRPTNVEESWRAGLTYAEIAKMGGALRRINYVDG